LNTNVYNLSKEFMLKSGRHMQKLGSFGKKKTFTIVNWFSLSEEKQFNDLAREKSCIKRVNIKTMNIRVFIK